MLKGFKKKTKKPGEFVTCDERLFQTNRDSQLLHTILTDGKCVFYAKIQNQIIMEGVGMLLDTYVHWISGCR
jgi:hypothetical protein